VLELVIHGSVDPLLFQRQCWFTFVGGPEGPVGRLYPTSSWGSVELPAFGGKNRGCVT
jgi:hypothetical protein